MTNEYAFEMATTGIRFGFGVTREVGAELVDLDKRHVLVFTDPSIRALPPVAAVLESLEKNKIHFSIFDRVRVEPSDESFREATTAAQFEDFDAFVAVGGGSTLDTAKAANLYSCYPADFLDYVNPPIGRGQPVPGPVKTLIAIPTTAGTGSETTGVAIFDFAKMKAKTGIAHRRLRPTIGLVDPENTRTMPSEVAASSGLDVLSHAIESYTAIPFQQRPRPERPILRPAYQGSNPISDLWSLEALRLVGSTCVAQWPIRGMTRPGPTCCSPRHTRESDLETRVCTCLTGCPIRSRAWCGVIAQGYSADHPLVPHGISVIVNAPAVFRFTSPACPERHLKAAEILGANVSGSRLEDAGRILADQIVELMQDLKVPNGLRELGYQFTDIPALVEGTLPQHRVTKLSPRPRDLTNWHDSLKSR